jgi:hypothetical protein
MHASSKRFIFMCCHRRAGKTVAIANHLIRAAMLNTRKTPPPRYAYVGPSFDQAKDLVWGYLKHFAGGIQGVRFREGELTAVLPNGATIKLYGGADAYQRMRGLYFDGIALDEFPLLEKTLFTAIVRPCLADYHGFAIVSGTSNGDDHFHRLLIRIEENPRWDVFIIPLSKTGNDALSQEEIEELTEDMEPDEYAREMECSFEAPVEGAYYAEAMNALASQKRITSVPPDLSVPAVTCWDLGIHDMTSIWTFQTCGRELHWIDYLEGRGHAFSHYTVILQARAQTGGFKYRAHLLPHDAEAREKSTGQSQAAAIMGLLEEPVIVVPRADPADGIQAVRGLLGMSFFDEKKCAKGLTRLRGYRKNEQGREIHDDASHAADSIRTGAMGFHLVGGFNAANLFSGRLRRRIRGLI